MGNGGNEGLRSEKKPAGVEAPSAAQVKSCCFVEEVGQRGTSICEVRRASLRMALYNSQSTEGTKPGTPAKRASANSACRLRSVNASGARRGPEGGKAWGTNARTDSPKVVEVE